MVRLPVNRLRTNAKELSLGSAKVFHLPDWHALSHPQRLAVIRQIAMMRGRDPRIPKLALKIFKKYGAQPREYDKQAAALLKWVQDPKNVYYVNEPGERLQDPLYTIKVGHGDCDDQILVLTCLFESVGLPWKLCLSGRDQSGQKVRHIEGDQPAQANWTHIYCMVGTPPYNPTKWWFCEPTVQGVPLGWDVVSGDHSYLPEMMKKPKGPARVVQVGQAPQGHRPTKMPRGNRQSPAYDEAYGGAMGRPNQVGAAVGASVATAIEDDGINWQRIGTAVMMGVTISVLTRVAYDYVTGGGIWKGEGHVGQKIGQATTRTFDESRFVLPANQGR